MSMALQLDVEKRAATDLTNAKLDYSAPVVHFLLLLHIKLVAVASKLPAYSFCLGSMCIKIGHMIKLFFARKDLLESEPIHENVNAIIHLF